MRALPDSVERAWRRLAAFADGRWGVPAVFVAALGVYAAVSYALPLSAGRDLARYLLVYAQLFDEEVVFPYALATRTPVTPLVAGGLLEAGAMAAEVGAALLYAISVVAWFLVARRFGGAAAFVIGIALLTYPGYVLLFHELSSDAIFAASFALCALLAARLAERPVAARAAAFGVGVAALVLVRPVNQVLLLLVAVPLLVTPTWRERLRSSAAFALAAIVPLLAWAGHNAIRVDDFTVARGGGATVPLFRAFARDRIVEPQNGEATRDLAAVVERSLLPYEPYRSYGIDLERFFSAGSTRMYEDLTVLSDRTWGWDDDYGHLARVGREAVLAHPGTFARGVARDFENLLVWPLYAENPERAESIAPPRALASAAPGQLPVPSEGEPIPSARQSPVISTPDGRIREVWTSPTEHHFVFSRRGDEARAAELDRRVSDLLGNLPERDAKPELVERLNSASRWYPRPVLWLLVGLAAVLLRRRRWLLAPVVLAAAGLLILLATSVAVYAIAQYSVPVTPAFMLLAVAGVLGRRPAIPSPS